MRLEDGRKVQRAEVRFDGVAGCLRTPRGGSSRQVLAVVEAGQVRTRLLTPREAARLMGLPDSYELPKAATSALHVAGDGRPRGALADAGNAGAAARHGA